MSEIKPVSIKTADQEMSEWMKSGQTSTMSYGELYAFFERQESKKLRSALEALQKENAELKDKVQESFVVSAKTKLVIFGSKESISAMNGLALESMELRESNAAQAKQIAEFERILEGVPEGAFEGGWTARGIMKHAADLVRENKSLRKHCNEQTEFRASQIKMLEQQNKSLIDQLTKVDLLTPRTYVIELPDGAELPNQHIRKEQNEG